MSDERWALGVERLKDGNMNSRGLLSPRYYIVSAYRGRLKDANRQPLPLVRVFADAICSLFTYSTGSRTRGYSPFGLPVFQTFICHRIIPYAFGWWAVIPQKG